MVSVIKPLSSRARGLAMNAPKPLISRVLPSSMNCSPCGSLPLTKRGTCKRIRGERRCSSTNETTWALDLTRDSLFAINLSISTRSDAVFQLQVGTHKRCFFVSHCAPEAYKKHRALSLPFEAPWSGNLRQLISIIVQSGTHLPLTPPDPFASIRSTQFQALSREVSLA